MNLRLEGGGESVSGFFAPESREIKFLQRILANWRRKEKKKKSEQLEFGTGPRIFSRQCAIFLLSVEIRWHLEI